MENQVEIIVVGAGISGFTTALLLKKAGYKVSIYYEEFPLSKLSDPTFASLYPAASVIPHSVYHPELNQIFEISQSIFSTLYQNDYPGLKKHKHFELFCFKTDAPDYLNRMSNLKIVSDIDWMPHHPEFKIQEGWVFNCYFADWDLYFPEIIKEFMRLDGIIINKKIDLNSLNELPADVIINCSGIGSNEIESETSSPLLLLGHLLKIPNTITPMDPDGNIVSYNFSPGKEIYSNTEHQPLDVYFYPGKKNWTLGGSRFKVSLDTTKDNYFKIHDEFPHQIKKINFEILAHTFGITTPDTDKELKKTGIRYLRNRENGLRLESENVKEKKIIHNYGHGGAGVTLSWGCSFRILNMVNNFTGIANTSLDEANQLLLDGLILDR